MNSGGSKPEHPVGIMLWGSYPELGVTEVAITLGTLQSETFTKENMDKTERKKCHFQTLEYRYKPGGWGLFSHPVT